MLSSMIDEFINTNNISYSIECIYSCISKYETICEFRTHSDLSFRDLTDLYVRFFSLLASVCLANRARTFAAMPSFMVCAKYVCSVSGSNLRSNRAAQDGATRQSSIHLSPFACSYVKEYREETGSGGTPLYHELDLFHWIEIGPDQMHLPGIVCEGTRNQKEDTDIQNP